MERQRISIHAEKVGRSLFFNYTIHMNPIVIKKVALEHPAIRTFAPSLNYVFEVAGHLLDHLTRLTLF